MNQITKTDTAHLEWGQRWQTPEGREAWIDAEKDVCETEHTLKDKGIVKVLDLGCGVGRHALWFAQQGYQVYAFDGSQSGLDYLKNKANEENLHIDIKQGEMVNLPYTSSFFDYVLAWNVIYHGDVSVVQRTISEVNRILRPGGIFQATMLSKRNVDTLTGKKIAYNTYINQNKSDKDHPHFYCNASELVQLLAGFEICNLKDREHRASGSFHWQFLAEKL